MSVLGTDRVRMFQKCIRPQKHIIPRARCVRLRSQTPPTPAPYATPLPCPNPRMLKRRDPLKMLSPKLLTKKKQKKMTNLSSHPKRCIIQMLVRMLVRAP